MPTAYFSRLIHFASLFSWDMRQYKPQGMQESEIRTRGSLLVTLAALDAIVFCLVVIEIRLTRWITESMGRIKYVAFAADISFGG